MRQYIRERARDSHCRDCWKPSPSVSCGATSCGHVQRSQRSRGAEECPPADRTIGEVATSGHCEMFAGALGVGEEIFGALFAPFSVLEDTPHSDISNEELQNTLTSLR